MAKNAGAYSRSRYEYGIPPSELWGKAQSDRDHTSVLQSDGRFVVVHRGTGAVVKKWGCGRTTKEVR